jgi:hypothetical protein
MMTSGVLSRLTLLFLTCAGTACSGSKGVVEDTAALNAKANAAAPSTAPSPWAPPIKAVDIDETPSWYRGSKPWKTVSRSEREKLLRLRAAYGAQEATARQPATGSSAEGDASAAAAGKRLINRIIAQYGLDPAYRTPDTFGSRMVIWLPEAAWNGLSANQKRSIEAYMSSQYTNWGIGVGRVRGKEVLLDNLVIER